MSTHLEAEQTAATSRVVELTYRDAIRAALDHALEEDPTVLLLGAALFTTVLRSLTAPAASIPW